MRDPVLDRPIEGPWPYRMRKVRRTWPHFLFLFGLVLLLVFAEDPGAPVVLAILVVFVGLVVLALPLVRTSLREIAAARAVRPLNQRAIDAVAVGDAVAAEALLRKAWSHPDLGPPALAGIVHNLGLARLYAGDPEGGRALMLHARASGWMATFRYGWPEAPNAPRDRAMIDVAWGLQHVRAGDPVEALRVLEGIDLDVLTPPVRSVVVAAGAFAAAALGGDPAAWLVRAEPLPLDHWAWERLGWPALVAFVESARTRTPV